MYAYVVCRLDIAHAITTLARFSAHPNRIHYQALKKVAIYLRSTIDWRLVYWRSKPCLQLPPGDAPLPLPQSASVQLADFPSLRPNELIGFVDAAHASDLTNRRSCTGIVFPFIGGAIAYRSKLQDIVATSSTEAEFYAAVAAAKTSALFYPNSVSLKLNQHDSTRTTRWLST
jgi:hypothetical protein